MSSESDRLRYEQILRSLLARRARIIRSALQPDWPAHPLGHLRKRPVFWVDRADALAMLDSGQLVVTDAGLDVSPADRARIFGVAAPTAPAAVPEPVEAPKAPARSRRTSVLTQLSRRRDADRRPLLSERQIAAAERYARDLAAAGEGRASTVDFGAARVDGTRRHDAAERSALARIDATRALAAARDRLGADLSRLLDRVCRDDESLPQIERSEGWSSGTALVILRMALDRLASGSGPRDRAAPDDLRTWRNGSEGAA